MRKLSTVQKLNYNDFSCTGMLIIMLSCCKCNSSFQYKGGNPINVQLDQIHKSCLSLHYFENVNSLFSTVNAANLKLVNLLISVHYIIFSGLDLD